MEDGHALGIVAFVCGTVDAPEAVVRTAQTTLPDYMVPRQVVVVEEMPLNANGKIDRRQLVELLTSAAT
jgi:acyl-CoA synthetase (AMP-forming)/AMP-acid ligase II